MNNHDKKVDVVFFSFQVSVAVAGALPVLAYLAIPAVHQVENLVVEEAEREVELCLTDNENKVLAADEESAFGASQVAALALFLLWKLMMGVAITTYWTLGVAYMVDAISPLVVPAALGACYVAAYFGGFLGNLLASACLGIDAWWLGFPILSLCHVVPTVMLMRLPANITEGNQLTPSFKLIGDTLKRLFQNKILMFDTLSLVFFLFAHANGNYLAKFIEFQFHVSPSKASLVSGTTRVIGNVIALIISTMVVTYFKPSARSLALYNFVADIVAVGVTISLVFIDCGSSGDLLTPSS